MSTAEKIRKELSFIVSESKDDKLLRLMYDLAKEYQCSPEEVELSADQQAELQRRKERREKGLSKSFSWSEVSAKLDTI